MLGRRSDGQAVAGQSCSTEVVTLSEAKRPKSPLITRLVRFLRSVAGMPDYDAHLEHLRRHHPGAPVPGRRAFYEQYLATRYGDAPTRCC